MSNFARTVWNIAKCPLFYFVDHQWGLFHSLLVINALIWGVVLGWLLPSLERRLHWKWRATFAAILVVAAFMWVLRMMQMPLKSYGGPLPVLTSGQSELRDRLLSSVKYLTVEIGERNVAKPGSLQRTADYLQGSLERMGYAVTQISYQIGTQRVTNIEAILPGRDNDPASNIVVGAHYDSVEGTVGANDNATGVAATLELARLLRGKKLSTSVRFVLFVNEEPPYFQTESMGSIVYARHLRRQGVRVSAMISLETIGYYSDAPGSQKYPFGFGLLYPDRGNFIGFVGNSASRDLVLRSIRVFRETTLFPSEGIAAPEALPGVGWSDQWSFWQEGYPGIMITDTAPFRYPYYHSLDDTFDKVDFDRVARVVSGVQQVLEALAAHR